MSDPRCLPPCPGRPASSGGERGISMVEVLVAMVLALFVALIAYGLIEYAKRSYVRETDLARVQSSGRSILDAVGIDLRAAGYSPLGATFTAVPAANASSIRFLADHDGDGVVGTATEPDENLTWRFEDPDGNGIFRLVRGVDLNGDGDFADAGESMHVVSEEIVPVDFDRNGSTEPFFAYNQPAPNTTEVLVTYGVRTVRRDAMRKAHPVTQFQTRINLRNRMAGML